MSKYRAGAVALAAALLFVSACQKDAQEAQKFERADTETFRRDMSALTSFTLANGVTVYVQEERTDDQVAVEVLYRAGFMVEPKGQPQISHLTEHAAIHCGMGAFGPGESKTAIEEQRGMLNAEAVADFVHIDYIVPGAQMEKVFEVEAERLRAVRCDQQTLDREISQVNSEIDKVLKDPKGVLTKFAMMALNQTYRFGLHHVPLQSQVGKFRVEDVHRFHDSTYRPDDMIVVVVGNIKTADVEALARKHFESIARRPLTPLAPPTLTRSTSATWDIGAETVYFLAPGPYQNDRERLLLTMFGSYLHQFLNSSPEAYGATRSLYCSNQVYRVADLPFFIYGEPTLGGSVSDVAAVLLNDLDRAIAALDDATVENIKGSIVNFATSSMLKPDVPDYPLAHFQVIGQEALNVAMKHLLREGRSTEEFTAEVMSVTPDELRAAVRKHLRREGLVRVTFAPRT